MISKTWFNKGDATYSYIALLTMFAKTGNFSYEGLIAALTVKRDGKLLKRTYKSFMKGQADPSLLAYISAIVNGKTPSIPKMDNVSFETNFFRNKL